MSLALRRDGFDNLVILHSYLSVRHVWDGEHFRLLLPCFHRDVASQAVSWLMTSTQKQTLSFWEDKSTLPSDAQRGEAGQFAAWLGAEQVTW